jgi:predicted short-subunit dehydrogenase-like oxidoreductase (DUF2520 family)
MANNSSTENVAVIVGTGRVAKAMGALLSRSGVQIAAIAGRDPGATLDASRFVYAERAVSLRELPRFVRRVLIAVSDTAISPVAAELADGGLSNCLVLHTSAAAGPDALAMLRAAGNSVGVLHPLQTVPSPERGVETLPGATYAVAGDARATAWARELVNRFGGKVLAVDSDSWGSYHAAAVMACNYQVTLVDAALELLQNAGIGRTEGLDALSAILRATTENILVLGPEAALTGPIRRGDIGTIGKHLEALDTARPETKRLYVAAGLRTLAIAGLSPDEAGELAQRLTGAS